MTPGGRKFTLTLTVVGFILLAATTMLVFGKLEPDHWLTSLDKVVLVAAGYLGANVVQKVGDAIGGKRTL